MSGTIRMGSPIASGRRGVSKSDLARSSAAAFQANNMSFVKRGSRVRRAPQNTGSTKSRCRFRTVVPDLESRIETRASRRRRRDMPACRRS